MYEITCGATTSLGPAWLLFSICVFQQRWDTDKFMFIMLHMI